MSEKEAILGFMMGERIKSGLIAANTMIGVLDGLAAENRKGGEQLLSVYLGYLAAETSVAGRVSPQREWEEVSRNLEQAQVKIDSGIPGEATYDLTTAISKAVTVSHRTMSHLKAKGLLA